MRNFWLVLLAPLFALFLTSCGGSEEQSFQPVEITETGSDWHDSLIAKVNRINDGKSRYYLENSDVFYLDYYESKQVRSEEVDIFRVRINADSVDFKDLKPILIKNLRQGETKVHVRLIDGEGNDLLPAHRKSVFKFYVHDSKPLITNDAVVFGILLIILALIFWTGSLDGFKKFYSIVPALLLCYFVPALLSSVGLYNAEHSSLYFVASRYLLPASLVLLCLSIDLKGVINLGPKAVIMFVSATIGIVVGGPLAVFIVGSINPDLFSQTQGGTEIWEGLSTVAGSWIGGGANQTAMKEIHSVNDTFFGSLIVVDVFVANFWMAFLLFGASRAAKLDRILKADSSAIEALRKKMEDFSLSSAKIPSTTNVFVVIAVGFGAVAFSHFFADWIKPIMADLIDETSSFASLRSHFFWLVVMATTLGVAFSFSKFRNLEGYGASRMGSVFIYILVATIGMKMDLRELINNWAILKWLMLIGLIWMAVHVSVLLTVAKLIRAPFFFVAVGSQANVGGAASAPVVASAFSPVLAPVGVLLAVLGYALGTYGALICAELMSAASP